MKSLRLLVHALSLSVSLYTDAATFTITTTNDSGVGSLRQVMLDANLTPDLDVITFKIPGAGPHTIAPLSPLPPITNALVIDGFTQSGAKPNALRAGNSAVFQIELSGANAGVSANGLEFKRENCVVRGLVINRFSGHGILVQQPPSSTRTVIEGNLIGTDVTGSAARPNGDGIAVFGGGDAARIGGDWPGARNVISGNTGQGIRLVGSYPAYYVSAPIQGNFIGTDINGTSALGNGSDGIRLDPASSIGWSPSIVGGPKSGDGNVIAANGGNGVYVTHRSAYTSMIQGNSIGTDLTGTIPLGNAQDGVFMSECGVRSIRNNRVAFNHGNGVRMAANNFFQPAPILSNFIFGNDGLGINLQPAFEPTNTVTPNDVADMDGGPNFLQNFPIITNVSAAGGVTTIAGILNSLKNSNFSIEFYRSPTADPSGYGEGKYSLGSTNVATDANGDASFSFVTSETCAGQFVTATATYGEYTSEFSPGFTVPGTFAGNFQFKLAEFVVTEAGAAAVIEVVRTDSAVGAASVDFLTIAGTATGGSDYTPTNGTLSFVDGETNKTFVVTVLNDTIAEQAETVSLVLTNPTSGAALGTTRSATLTIIDDEALPSISIDDVSINEGNGGSTFVFFNVSLSASNAAPVSVAFATALGSAAADVDFTSSSGAVTFAPGETEAPITIIVMGDSLNEANETFSVNLSYPTNATIADRQGIGTILNDDPAPQLTIGNASATEGNAGTKQCNFQVNLSAPSGQSIQVDYFTSENTANAATDYQAQSGTLVFPPEVTNQSIGINLIGDLTFEADETFFVILTNATVATIAAGQDVGIGTIQNDDPVPPMISIDDINISEGNGGSTFAAFTVSLSASNAQTISVSYAASNGTAVAGLDYVQSPGLVTFNPGEIIKPITVTIKGDTTAEPNETFFVNLSDPTNAALARTSAVATILDDDKPTLQISRVANNAVLSWTTNSTGFGLYAAESLLAPAAWQSVTNPIVISNDSYTVTESLTNQARFYRLQAP